MGQRVVPNVAIDKRLANALFANAKMSNQAVAEISKFVGRFVEGAAINPKALQATLGAFSEHYGGLWVGGKATLTDRALLFEPNALNRFIHENGDALQLNLDLKQIDSVTTRFGWLTGIIDITMGDAVISIRCFGSKAFATNIERTRSSVSIG